MKHRAGRPNRPELVSKAVLSSELFLGPIFRDGTKGKMIRELFNLLPTHPDQFARRNP